MKARWLDEQDLETVNGRVRVKRVGAGIPSGDCRARTAGPITPTPSPYKSKWEAAYAQHLELMKKVGEIVDFWYEPIRFRLPGKANFYKPDFVVQRHRDFEVNGYRARLEIHEVKGWSKNRREGITKFKTAAGLNPWAIFKLIRYENGQWIES